MRLLVVAPRTGATWVREGLLAFRRQPMAFFSLFMLFMSAIALLSRLPVLGSALAVALGPATTLALMVVAQRSAQPGPAAAAKGRAASASLFLAALQAVAERAKALAVLGALYAAGVLVVGALATAIAGDPFASAFDDQGAPRPEVIQSAGFQAALLLRMALYLPVSLLFWHAPALVHWHGVAPVKSLFFSFVTCLRNFGAMAIYGLVWVGVIVAASLVLSLVAGLAVVAAGPLGLAVMVGGSFVLSAMFLGSTWFSFRDCFQAD